MTKSSGRLPRLEDMAERAGVSHQTVSRVIHDHPNVSKSTREAILDAVRHFLGQSVDGIVVIVPHSETLLALAEVHPGDPVVAVGSLVGTAVGGAMVDQKRGAELAVRHLVDQGHRRIGHVAGPQDWIDGVARAEGSSAWEPKPDFATSAGAWLTAGAAHHTVLSTQVGMDVFEDFAEIARTELLTIDEDTTIKQFKKELAWNAAYYKLDSGL